jgi:hypothetical protein
MRKLLHAALADIACIDPPPGFDSTDSARNVSVAQLWQG